MNTPNKDIDKAEVRIKWDPSPAGEPATDLDIIAATYASDAPFGSPVYLVHFDSRAPDGTITLNRDSKTGQGFGFDEVMTLELNRLSDAYSRVVVGVAIQQRDGRKTFGQVEQTAVQILEGYTTLAEDDFSGVPAATARSSPSSPGTPPAPGGSTARSAGSTPTRRRSPRRWEAASTDDRQRERHRHAEKGTGPWAGPLRTPLSHTAGSFTAGRSGARPTTCPARPRPGQRHRRPVSCIRWSSRSPRRCSRSPRAASSYRRRSRAGRRR